MAEILMYLLDTNIWPELLLDQERADEVYVFLEEIPVSQILITDFTLHSIGVVCNRYKRPQVFKDFLQDIVVNGQISLSVIPIDELSTVVDATIELGLDFDDAYRYICAERDDATLITFDKDFDSTSRGRQIPAEVLAMLKTLSQEENDESTASST